MNIRIFKPAYFKKSELDLSKLPGSKNWIYTSSGKASIFHILKSHNIQGKILLPAYACRSILTPIERLGLEPVFYDLDLQDLNPSLDSIRELSLKNNIKVILVPSLYGNPANMEEIEKFCREEQILLIDDGAQSLGASLSGRAIGTFGDCGFFSFSPGKATAAHMGSFFWQNQESTIRVSKHCFIHYIKWLSFYFNRLKIDNPICRIIGRPLFYVDIICSKKFDLVSDDICAFERPILGGVINALYNGDFDFRQKWANHFKENLQNSNFTVVTALRGIPHNHKHILLCNSREIAHSLINFLTKNNIYSSNGYKLLTNELSLLPNCKKVDGRVVEIPIENNDAKMTNLFDLLQNFKHEVF